MANRIPDERADRGGMTGATGNLTSDTADEEFVPAETRELTDPSAARHLTAAAHQRAGERATPAAPPRAVGGETVLGGDEQREPEEEHL